MRGLLASACVVLACASTVGVDRSGAADATADATTDAAATSATDAATALDRPAARCVAGAEEACPCPDGFSHARRCNADGLFGECGCSFHVVPRTYDYVITRRLLDRGAEPGVTTRAFYGFNLDGRFSPRELASQEPADCAHGDHFSAVDPDQDMGTCVVGAASGGAGCRGGVDNRLGDLVQALMQFQEPVDPQGLLDEGIGTGREVALIRVSGVDAPVGPTLDDASVRVFIYSRAWATFADCAEIARPNRTYTVDDRSLTVPHDLSSARVQFVGRIVRGRLEIVATADAHLPVLVPLLGPLIELPAYGPRLRFTPGEVEGTDGNIGGYLRPTDLVDALVTRPGFMPLRDAALGLFQGFADIATGTPTASCESPNGRIGVGIGFRALRAVIAPTTVAAAPAGVCGG